MSTGTGRGSPRVLRDIARAAIVAWVDAAPQLEAADLMGAGASFRGSAGEPAGNTGIGTTAPEMSSIGSASPARETVLPALRAFAATAYRDGAESFGDAIGLATADRTSPVAEAWQRVAELPLAELLDPPAVDIEAAWSQFLRFDDRERTILAARIYATGPRRTLDELGTELGVTRERVRQIESRIRQDLEARRHAGRGTAPVAHLAARLRRRLGTLTTERLMRTALEEAVPADGTDDELRRAALRELAGPYREAAGLWQCHRTLDRLRSAVLADGDAHRTPEQVEVLLAAAGVADGARDTVVRALPLRRLGDLFVVWTGALQDKACRILRAHGRPMSREELHAAAGADEVNARSLINAIQADERIHRLGLDSYGLAEWNGRAYSSIADEIENEIDRAGGRAPTNLVIQALVDRFGVAESSVRASLVGGRFRRDADGFLTVAPARAEHGTTAGAQITAMPPHLDRDLVRSDGTWALRIAVDAELLRGSGRATRNAIAQAAGLEPGDSRTITLTNGMITIAWTRPQPARSSVRALALTLGAAEGDLLIVPLTDGGTAHHVPRRRIEAARGTGRVAFEVGLTDPDPGLLRIAEAIGLEGSASVDEVRDRLRQRRQGELADAIAT